MPPTIPLPRAWNRRTKSAILQILALSHYAFTAMVARTANERSRRTRLRAEIDRLSHELALLREELRIKDARMARVPPHRRPHYTPLERMAILELRAARGWSARQTAKRLHLTVTTVGAWMGRINEEGPHALLQIRQPVNRCTGPAILDTTLSESPMPRKIPLTRMLSPDGQLGIIEPSAGNLGDAGPVQRCRLQRLTVGQPYPASSRPGIAEDEDAAGIVEKAMERDGVDTRCAAKMHQGTTMR